MKRTLLLAAIAAISLAACNNSTDDAQIAQDVHRLVAKTEQCYANVHNDLLDSMDFEYFRVCNDELTEMMTDIEKKYKNDDDRRKFDSLFMAEIQESNLDNDLIDLMEEIYNMNSEK